MARSNSLLGCMTTVLLLSVAAADEGSATAEATSASIDLSPIFAQSGLATRCQGERGTCSVFVVTDAIEYAIASRQRQATRLSVEFLNWASNQTTKTPQDGGFFSDLWKGCARFGICPGGGHAVLGPIRSRDPAQLSRR